MLKWGLLLRQFLLVQVACSAQKLGGIRPGEGGEIKLRKVCREGKDNGDFIFKALPVPVPYPFLACHTWAEEG